MAAQPLARRVDRLEQRMDALETLPAQVAHLALQVSQFRDDVAREFSAVRQEFRAEMTAQGETLRGEMATQGETLRDEMAAQGAQLRREIREVDEETRRYMRVLHDEVIDRLKHLQEGLAAHEAPLTSRHDDGVLGRHHRSAGRARGARARPPQRGRRTGLEVLHEPDSSLRARSLA